MRQIFPWEQSYIYTVQNVGCLLTLCRCKHASELSVSLDLLWSFRTLKYKVHFHGLFFLDFVAFTFSLLWQIPVGRDHIHHEVELGVVIGKTGLNIPQAQAMDYVGGYALALDMTDLDLIFKRVSFPIT